MFANKQRNSEINAYFKNNNQLANNLYLNTINVYEDMVLNPPSEKQFHDITK